MKLSNRKKNNRQKAFRKSAAGIKLSPNCMNCGGKGPHFVPPSFGDAGFFICTKGVDHE